MILDLSCRHEFVPYRYKRVADEKKGVESLVLQQVVCVQCMWVRTIKPVKKAE